MADTLVNTLYPPVVETFQPAFVYTDSAVVTFSLSPFNSANDINYIHLSIVDQRNNENVLKETVPWSTNAGIFNGILVMKFPHFPNESGIATQDQFVYDANADLYSVSISPNWLNQAEGDTVPAEKEIPDENLTDEDGNPVSATEIVDSHYYNVGQYYKVQIRFDETSEDIGDQQDKASHGDSAAAQFIANYMTTQRPYFSEWSEVTLVKPIYPIKLYMTKFDANEDEELLSFNKGLLRLSGIVTFVPDEKHEDYPDNEHLQSYRLLVTNINTQKIFFDSGEVYAEKSPDGRYGINYLLDTEHAKEYDNFNVNITLTTNNGYVMSKDYQFSIAEFYDGDFKNPIWNNKDYENHPTEEISSERDIVVNQEDGIVYINFSCPGCGTPGTLYIKRACSKDNYTNWQIISTTKHKGGDVKTSFVDYTPCSLETYQYAAQYEYYGGLWSEVWYSNKVYLKFYDMLLMRQNRQIAIRYNGKPTSWKPIINRQKIDTLGGKYPKFVENATLGYKQYAISGIISAEADFNRKFLNENDGKWIDNGDETYSYRYYYQEGVQQYNKHFDSRYLVRNDTVADGEYGYEPKKVVDPHGETYPQHGNLYYGDANNPYISEKTEQQMQDSIYTDSEYSKSIFDDSGYALEHQHDLYPHLNWYWEREFREHLVDWLNDGEPKLYRSMPEGNMAAILMDINLTPATNDRLLYNFSATLYEVGSGYDMEVLDSLGIIELPKLAKVYVPGADYTDNVDPSEEDISYVVTRIGQMYEQAVWGRDMITGSSLGNEWIDYSILERLQAQQGGYLKNNEILSNSLQLTNVKLTFVSEPHYYEQTDNSWSRWPDDRAASDNTHLWLGYLIKINSIPIFVNERGYYQVPNDTYVTKLEIAEGDICVVDYILSYKQQYGVSNIPKRTKLYKKLMGQQAGMFQANQAIGNDIYYKYAMIEYNLNSDKQTKDMHSPSFVQSLQTWKGVCIEVSPYAMVGIKYTGDTNFGEYLISRHGALHLLEDTPVEDIIFLGRKMFLVEDPTRQPYLDEWEFIIDPDKERHNDENRNWFEMRDGIIYDTGKLVYINFFNEEYIGKPYQGWLTIGEAAEANGYNGNVKNIRNPKYNTVYTIGTGEKAQTYIYYIDGKFYPIAIANDGTALAAVPVYGVVNYRADLVRSEYS